MLVLASVAVMLDDVVAATVEGTIRNGTTGATNVEADVAIINPSAGMMSQRTVHASGGEFTVDDLEAGVYIARVTYKGVAYNEQFQIGGAGPVDVSVSVYEPTTSWDGVRVIVPHVTGSRRDGHLVIERVYDIMNESDPPRTMTGEDGYFRFPLPDDLHDFTALYVEYSGVPIERQPVETGETGVWRVEYPIRPGVTRVAMAYTVDYSAAEYEIHEKALYDIDEFTIFATDPGMEVTSSTHELVREEGPHASVSWVIHGIKRGDTFELRFQGGTPQQAAGGAQPVVSIIPNRAEGLSLLIMFILLLTLVAFIGIALKEPHATDVEAPRLKEYRDVLVRRLAKLDDLYETGAVPAAVYHSKRADVKNQIASLMYRLNMGGGSGAKRIQSGTRKRSGAK
jgi:hypothetical protein